MAATKLKVLIIGGGPVGLTAAAALHRAGIDFRLLERRSHVVEQVGSSLVLSPAGMKALCSLGLLDQIYAVSQPLHRNHRFNHKGQSLGTSDIFTYLGAATGYQPRVISRHDLSQVIYDSLSPSSKGKILVNKSLHKIVTTASGAEAETTDGSRYSADIIIGADGAHSKTRSLMRQLALAAGSTCVNDITPFETTFRCLWLRFKKPDDMTPGHVSESHGSNVATQLFAGESDGVIGVYERIAGGSTKQPPRWTTEDEAALIERWGHIVVSTNTTRTLGDLYHNFRMDSGLVNLEEGLVNHWSWNGRIVLAGDAAHKFTPSVGAGCNAGIADIAALVTEIQRVLAASPTSLPQQGAFTAALHAYQARRHQEVESECAVSGNATRTATWTTSVHRLVDTHIMSLAFVQKFLIASGSKKFASSPAFDFSDGIYSTKLITASN